MSKSREAVFFRQLDNNRVICDLCPRNCIIDNNQTSVCRSRKNINGKLFSENYGKITAYRMDPIEKKPLLHYYPGKRIFSIGSFGCNLHCQFCQNHEIAHGNPHFIETTPENLADIAENEKNNIGIAYTYNEPIIWFEFLMDIMPLVNKSGLKNILVTNGYIEEKPLEILLEHVDAMNIDLKGFSDHFYKSFCGSDLNPVKKTIKKASNVCHVEITTLIVPGLNDTKEEMEHMARWLSSIDPSIPLHLSRYFPSYKLNLPETDIDTLYGLQVEAKKFLEYVYIGNVSQVDMNTYCPRCNNLVVERNGSSNIKGLKDGNCTTCEYSINIRY